MPCGRICGRLTLDSSWPVSASDDKEPLLYFTPHLGNTVAIWDGSAFVDHAFAELPYMLDSDDEHDGYHAPDAAYDFFAFLNGSTFTIGSYAWASLTERAEALEVVDGLHVNASQIALRYGVEANDIVNVDARKARFIGSIKTMLHDGITQVEDSIEYRCIWNMHRMPRPVASLARLASWSYSTATFRRMAGETSSKVGYFSGLGIDPVDLTNISMCKNSTSTPRSVINNIAIDTDSGIIGRGAGASTCTDTHYAAPVARFSGFAPLGYHEFIPVEKGAGAEAQEWFGETSDGCAGMSGHVWA